MFSHVIEKVLLKKLMTKLIVKCVCVCALFFSSLKQLRDKFRLYDSPKKCFIHARFKTGKKNNTQSQEIIKE